MSKRKRPRAQTPTGRSGDSAGSDDDVGRPEPEEMATLRCPSCGRSLYMSLRTLQSSSWRCPACGTKIRPSADAVAATDTR